MKIYNAPSAELLAVADTDIMTASLGVSDPIALGDFETVRNALDSWWE
ncbi:MAG: hypothetical protein IJ011_08120 [Clostridia bacterium]|nr:hypothetical protein [Clostridia bacterium]